MSAALAQAQAALLLFTEALLLPCLLALGAGVALTLTHAGGAAREALQRRRGRPAFRRWLEGWLAAPGRPLRPGDLPAGYGILCRLLTAARAAPGSAGKRLDDLHLAAERSLDRLTLGVRLGPMLGLAGTLIPIGPALVALSTGDIETLARQLVVAFGTTVVGLLIGGGCYGLHTLRRGWLAQDLDDARYLLERLEVSDAAGATEPAPPGPG